MKLLLDTHCLLWWLDDPALLSMQAQTLALSQKGSDPFNGK